MIPTTDKSTSAVPAGFRVVEITREPVELYKILKFESLVASGGEAKAAIAAGQVQVNGKTEMQKRKQIVTGDTIEFADAKIFIKHALIKSENATPVVVKEKPPAKKKPVARKAISIATPRKKINRK